MVYYGQTKNKCVAIKPKQEIFINMQRLKKRQAEIKRGFVGLIQFFNTLAKRSKIVCRTKSTRVQFLMKQQLASRRNIKRKIFYGVFMY